MEDLASANIPGSEWTLEMPGWAQRCSNTRPPDGPAAHVGTQNQTYLHNTLPGSYGGPTRFQI